MALQRRRRAGLSDTTSSSRGFLAEALGAIQGNEAPRCRQDSSPAHRMARERFVAAEVTRLHPGPKRVAQASEKLEPRYLGCYRTRQRRERDCNLLAVWANSAHHDNPAPANSSPGTAGRAP